MPLRAPRTDTTKKQVQLARREQELRHAIRAMRPREQLVRAAEAVRMARLGVFKAELYWAKEAMITGGEVDNRILNIQRDQQRWLEKSVDEIIGDYTMASPRGGVS